MQRTPHPVFVALLLLCCLQVCGQHMFEGEVIDIHIDFGREDWREVLVDAKKSEDKTRLNANVKIDGKSFSGVQVKFKGNSSFHGALKAGYRKMPFNLKAAETDLFPGGNETLKLSNNFRDPTAIREKLAYDIAGTYVPVPRCAVAAVTVNGEYLGVYTATEGINREMISRYFCDRKKALVQCEPNFEQPFTKGCPRGSYSSLEYLGDDKICYENLYELKDNELWNDLIRLTRVLRDSTEKIEELLDVHMALWMHAVNNVLVNFDSYLGLFCHNYYLFQDHDGVFHPLLWDLNLAFGGFYGLKSGVDIEFAQLSPMIHERINMDNRPLITKLLEHHRYRNLYLSMVRTLVDDWFANDRYFERAEELREKIRPFIEKEQEAFFSVMDFDSSMYRTVKSTGRSIPGIAELMTERVSYLSAHPLLNKPVIGEVEVAFDKVNNTLKITSKEQLDEVRAWVRYTDCESFKSVFMQAGTDYIFSCQLSREPYAYYFELVNQDSAELWPREAPGGALRP